MSVLRQHARAIWDAAVDAVRPEPLLASALADAQLRSVLNEADRILVVGAGKAGAAMSRAVEGALQHRGDQLTGFVNVPANCVELPHIHLHAARPAASNQPTAEGVEGARRILELVRS